MGATDDELRGTSAGQAGGAIRAAFTAFPDSLDPALSYTQPGWQSLWLVYTPLLTYKHVEGVEGGAADPRSGRSAP